MSRLTIIVLSQIGMVLIVVALIFSSLKKYIFQKIPPVVFESVGIAILYLILGVQNFSSLTVIPISLALFLIITFVVDPFVWYKQGYEVSKKQAILVNIIAVGPGLATFLMSKLIV